MAPPNADLSPQARDYIYARLNELGLSQNQLAERAGVDQGALSRMLSLKASPTLRTLQKVAGALGVEVGVLLSGGPSLSPINAVPLEEARAPYARRLPVFRWGAAGDPTNPDDAPLPDHEDYPPVGRESLVGLNGFGVEVRGESMARRDIHDGDTVWVNPDRLYRSGDVVVAHVRDCHSVDGSDNDGMVVKTFRKTPDGAALYNDGAEPYGQKWLQCQEFTISGPVVWVSPRGFPPQR